MGIPGLTDRVVPRRLGPKRAGKIRKLFNLTKEDDVTQYIIRRPIPTKEGKPEPAKPEKSPQDPASGHSSTTSTQEACDGTEASTQFKGEARGITVREDACEEAQRGEGEAAR